nr:unnamed protein product [Callosobruchus analis]
MTVRRKSQETIVANTLHYGLRSSVNRDQYINTTKRQCTFYTKRFHRREKRGQRLSEENIIIGLIDQARDGAGTNPQVIQLLDKVEDMLRCTELYSPHVKEDNRMKTDEPVVSDLITALLSKQPQPTFAASSRRSSNDSSAFRPSRTGLLKLPAALKDLLETCLSWEFDIFRLEDLTRKRPLQHLGMAIFTHFDVASTLNCDEKTILNWLTVIEVNYHPENAYHNSTHAADVMQATANYLEKERMKSLMDPLDEATSLIAAAAHDVDHPGKSSAFLSNSDNPLAILYNDVTVLE